MKLLEYQGKEVLRKAGIKTPDGRVINKENLSSDISQELTHKGRVVVKAQVPVGGRGKAGGVKIVENKEELNEVLFDLLNNFELKGYKAENVLVEEALDISQEMYMSFIIDNTSGEYVFLFSPEGGMEIEDLAKEKPARLLKYSFPPNFEPRGYIFINILKEFGISGELIKPLADTALKLFKLMKSSDLTLAEINPLVILEDGSILAADAKVEVDDNALKRQKEYIKWVAPAADPLEQRAKEIGVTYVRLEGEVGIIASGAGLAMNTMDLVNDLGYKPANFLETGGGITRQLMAGSVEVVCSNENVKGLIVNLYGGVNSLLEAANGVVEGKARIKRSLPIVVKALGNQQDECWKILEDNSIPVVKNACTEDAVGILLDLMGGK